MARSTTSISWNAAPRYVPASALARHRYRRDKAVAVSQPLRLFERRRRPVRAGLRTQLRSRDLRAAHELHLRAAPERHRGSGLGRAFSDPSDSRDGRSRFTATASRCAICCSSTISSDALLLAEQHLPEIAGQAFNIGGGPDNTVSLLELIARIAALHGAAPRVEFGDWRVGDQRWYVSDTAKFGRTTGWRPQVGVAEGIRLPA